MSLFHFHNRFLHFYVKCFRIKSWWIIFVILVISVVSTYDHSEVFPGPKLNMIVGANGTWVQYSVCHLPGPGWKNSCPGPRRQGESLSSDHWELVLARVTLLYCRLSIISGHFTPAICCPAFSRHCTKGFYKCKNSQYDLHIHTVDYICVVKYSKICVNAVFAFADALEAVVSRLFGCL